MAIIDFGFVCQPTLKLLPQLLVQILQQTKKVKNMERKNIYIYYAFI